MRWLVGDWWIWEDVFIKITPGCVEYHTRHAAYPLVSDAFDQAFAEIRQRQEAALRARPE